MLFNDNYIFLINDLFLYNCYILFKILIRIGYIKYKLNYSIIRQRLVTRRNKNMFDPGT